MSNDLVTVRIEATQRVRYCQTVQMPRVEFEALKNSTDDNEWASTAETYLDLMDVYDADDMDDVDISEVKDK